MTTTALAEATTSLALMPDFLDPMKLIGYFGTHLALVVTTGIWNNIRSMITGWYVLSKHDGVGP